MARPRKETVQNTNDDLEKLLGNSPILSAKEYLSTGSTLLDYAIANKRNGGIPVGRITEIYGDEASGKSLLAYHILASTQKKGGIGIYIDVERAADETFMQRMGVDTKKNFIYPKPPKHIEGMFQYIEEVVKVVRTRFPNKEKLVTVVWDSVAATSAKEQIELEYGEGRITPEARAMSSCLKKAIDMLEQGYITLVCINQIRKNVGVMFGDPDVTPHGKSLAFYASTRIKLTKSGKIKDSQNKSRIIGVNGRAKVTKNKIAPPFKDAEFPVLFEWGVDDQASWIDPLKDFGYIKQAGPWATLKLDGEEYKFQGDKGFKEVLTNNKLCDKILDIFEKELIWDLSKRPEDLLVVKDAIMEDA